MIQYDNMRKCTRCKELKEEAEFPILDWKAREAKWCTTCRLSYTGNTKKQQFNPRGLIGESFRAMKKPEIEPISLEQAMDLLARNARIFHKICCSYCLREATDWQIDQLMANGRLELVIICQACHDRKYCNESN